MENLYMLLIFTLDGSCCLFFGSGRKLPYKQFLGHRTKDTIIEAKEDMSSSLCKQEYSSLHSHQELPPQDTVKLGTLTSLAITTFHLQYS